MPPLLPFLRFHISCSVRPFAAYLRLAALQVPLDGVYETVKDEWREWGQGRSRDVGVRLVAFDDD